MIQAAATLFFHGKLDDVLTSVATISWTSALCFDSVQECILNQMSFALMETMPSALLKSLGSKNNGLAKESPRSLGSTLKSSQGSSAQSVRAANCTSLHSAAALLQTQCFHTTVVDSIGQASTYFSAQSRMFVNMRPHVNDIWQLNVINTQLLGIYGIDIISELVSEIKEDHRRVPDTSGSIVILPNCGLPGSGRMPTPAQVSDARQQWVSAFQNSGLEVRPLCARWQPPYVGEDVYLLLVAADAAQRADLCTERRAGLHGFRSTSLWKRGQLDSPLVLPRCHRVWASSRSADVRQQLVANSSLYTSVLDSVGSVLITGCNAGIHVRDWTMASPHLALAVAHWGRFQNLFLFSGIVYKHIFRGRRDPANIKATIDRTIADELVLRSRLGHMLLPEYTWYSNFIALTDEQANA